MKTITEFDGFTLKNALSKKKELLAGGKAAEELPQALGEALKLEGDKLTYFLHALEVAEAKSDNLKRVIVLAVDEGKTAPNGAVQKAERHYLAEFFYTPAPKRPARSEGPGKGRNKKRGRKGGRRRPQEEGKGQVARDGKTDAGAPSSNREQRPRGPRRPQRGPKPNNPTQAQKPNVSPVNTAAKPQNDGTTPTGA
ncbi:MAG: hypothetical protein AB1540_08000 [Bdellovibrionota bacterium]